MANLGDNNTPVEGESFGLPSGFSIDENSGNLAIRDTNGNVVAEWDETNTQWDFANNTLNNVDALDSNSVNTVDADVETHAKGVLPATSDKFEYNGEPAEIEFPNTSTDYKIVMDLTLISGVSSGNSFVCQFSTDGGDTWLDTGDYNWVLKQHDSGGNDRSANAVGSDYIRLAENTADAGDGRGEMQIVLSPNSSVNFVRWNGVTERNNDTAFVRGGGIVTDAPVNAMRFLSDDANIADVGLLRGRVRVIPALTNELGGVEL